MASYSSRLPAIGGRRDRAAQRTNHPLNNRPRRPSLLDAQAEADALAARPAQRRHRDARGLRIGPRVALHRPSSSFWWCCCLYQCPYQNFKLPSLTSSLCSTLLLEAGARRWRGRRLSSCRQSCPRSPSSKRYTTGGRRLHVDDFGRRPRPGRRRRAAMACPSLLELCSELCAKTVFRTLYYRWTSATRR